METKKSMSGTNTGSVDPRLGMDSPEYLRERVTQLEWEMEKLGEIKNVDGIGKEELLKLRAKTEKDEIQWRIQQSGKNNGKIWARVIPYIDARAVIERLDHCVGPHRWTDEYREIQGGFACKLSIYTRNGWVSKEDGADRTEIEAVKGGISDALKRAAVKWGIGRDLYNYQAIFAEISTEKKDGFDYAKTKEGEIFFWRVS
jgi:hypothetical protein